MLWSASFDNYFLELRHIGPKLLIPYLCLEIEFFIILSPAGVFWSWHSEASKQNVDRHPQRWTAVLLSFSYHSLSWDLRPQPWTPGSSQSRAANGTFAMHYVLPWVRRPSRRRKRCLRRLSPAAEPGTSSASSQLHSNPALRNTFVLNNPYNLEAAQSSEFHYENDSLYFTFRDYIQSLLNLVV